MKKGSIGAVRQRLAGVRAKAEKTAAQVGPNPHREFGMKRAVVVAVAGGAVAGWLSLPMACTSVKNSTLGNVETTSAAPIDPAAVVAEQVRATAVGQSFLGQWLVADKASAGRLSSAMLVAPETLPLPDQAPAAPSSITLSGASTPAPGVWLVTFHVVGGASGVGETYQVPVKVAGQQASVLALPSRVGEVGPLAQEADTTKTPLLQTSVAAQTAVGFLQSWLSGARDINRWTTTTFTPTPVTSQLCRQVVLLNASTSQADQQKLAALGGTAVAGSPGADSTPSATPQTGPAQSSDPNATAGVTATVTCSTGSASRLLTYQLQLESVAGQLAVSAVNPYSR